jgi:hypothetical protein
MGYDFAYRINGSKHDCSLVHISRHNHFLHDTIIEERKFTYNELHEEITNILEKLRVAKEDRDQIGEAVCVLISVYSEMEEEDFVSIDYC